MRIADMRVHSIAIADRPLRSSYGLHAPFALRTILELESDDGIIGISETHGGGSNALMFGSAATGAAQALRSGGTAGDAAAMAVSGVDVALGGLRA